MSFERYCKVFDDYKSGLNLRPHGDAAEFTLNVAPKKDKRYRLFVVGETALFYQWNDEPDYPAHYRTITDALDTAHAYRSQYCLNYSSAKPEAYMRCAYKKVMWPPVISYLEMNPVPENWTMGIWACARNLKFEKNGYLRMHIDVRLKRENVNRHSMAFRPDYTVTIDFPEGDFDWREFSRTLNIPAENTANVGAWLEGAGYSGEVYFEHPFLESSSEFNMLPEFSVPTSDKEQFDWSAQYLSRKEWPEFRISMDGREIFRGEVFERCHLDSEWEIDLPAAKLREGAKLSVQLISDYHDPLPYIIHEVGVIEQPDGAAALIACAHAGTAHGDAKILLRTGHDNVKVSFTFPEGKLCGPAELTFDKAGLHGVKLECGAACADAHFIMEAEDCRTEGIIDRVVERAEDNVITGTGDMIYIEQRMDYVEEYLSWYVSNGVGNLLTIRPTYRWSGTRILDPKVWETVIRVLNELDIRYSLMLDGRELPGISTNPDNAMLAGKGFLGRQGHECDGAMYYWGTRGGNVSVMTEQVGDMVQRAYADDPNHTSFRYAPENYIYMGNDIYLYRDPTIPHDVRDGMKRSVAQLARTRGNALRHTGPSVMFKYILAAGYEWVGAETMYGSMEPLMSFLRGANLCYGHTAMGVHHAVQWSSSPQDVEEHFRRYRLALYVSYMQGATEINTEEGLWHLEEYYSHFHRFSAGCMNHLKQQQDFYKYVSTHARTGKFYTPMALLHGRCDGWHAFGHNCPWGWRGVKDSDAEKSWDLLKVFYPLSKPGAALYLHGCDTDHAVGYHTGTPQGNVDALPVESSGKLMSMYGAMAFMGYNMADADDFSRLEQYVRDGGKLLMTRAHMTVTTAADDIAAGRLSYDVNPLGFTDGLPVFKTSSVNGVPVQVCINAREPEEVLSRTDDGLPLVCRYELGSGSVILVNANAYPAHPAIRALYEHELEALMRELDAREIAGKGWVECGDDMQFTVYDQADGQRHIYLLATDWFRAMEPARSAHVRVGGASYEVKLPFGVMVKCVSDGRRAAWPHTEMGDVLCLTEKGARVQGSGKVTFTLAQNGVAEAVEVDFTDGALREIEF